MKKEDKIRQHLQFFGRVQGVGFRYTAQYTASSLGLTGWVYNEYDGTVVMEVQGRESSIKKMIEKLDSGMFIHIERIEKSIIPLDEHELSFHIR